MLLSIHRWNLRVQTHMSTAFIVTPTLPATYVYASHKINQRRSRWAFTYVHWQFPSENGLDTCMWCHISLVCQVHRSVLQQAPTYVYELYVSLGAFQELMHSTQLSAMFHSHVASHHPSHTPHTHTHTHLLLGWSLQLFPSRSGPRHTCRSLGKPHGWSWWLHQAPLDSYNEQYQPATKHSKGQGSVTRMYVNWGRHTEAFANSKHIPTAINTQASYTHGTCKL